jgi:hypothetical protein
MFQFRTKLISRGRVSNLLGTLLIVISFGLAVLAVCSPLYYEFPRDGARLVSVDGSSVIEHPFGTFEGDKKLALIYRGRVSEHTPYWNYPQKTVAVLPSGVEYFVEGELVDSIRFLRDKSFPYMKTSSAVIFSDGTDSNFDRSEKEIRELLRYWSYELNAEHAETLSQFTNPLDESQVAEMRKIIEPWFNERLEEKGIRVYFTGFTLR